MEEAKLNAKGIAVVVDFFFRKYANNVQFNIMDVGKVMAAAENILVVGGKVKDAEAAMLVAIEKYKVN